MSLPTARLEVVAGRAAGMFILVNDELLIGRHADGAGRLAEDDEISRSHARLSVDRSGFYAIEDLGSTNGTFVNGLRLTGPQTLSEGDTIELGGTTLVVRKLPTPTRVESLTSSSIRTGGERTPTTRPRSLRASGREGTSASFDDQPTEGADALPAGAEQRQAGDGEAPASVSLHVTVDFVAGEATVALGEGSAAQRFVFDGAAWRSAASESD